MSTAPLAADVEYLTTAAGLVWYERRFTVSRAGAGCYMLKQQGVADASRRAGLFRWGVSAQHSIMVLFTLQGYSEALLQLEASRVCLLPIVTTRPFGQIGDSDQWEMRFLS